MRRRTQLKRRIISLLSAICLVAGLLPADVCMAGSLKDGGTAAFDTNDSSFVDGGNVTGYDFIEIPENADKTVYIAGEGRIYYIPGNGKEPDKLVMDNAYTQGYIELPQSASNIILEVKGSNEAGGIDCWGTMTLTGSGSLTSILGVGGFSEDGFSGELNALVGVFPDNGVTQIFAYGNAVFPFEEFIINIGYDGNAISTLAVLPDASLTILENSSFIIHVVDDNVDDYIDIQGEIINNGELVLEGLIPDDVAGFIKSLHLSGNGIVNVYYVNGEQAFYSNSGNKLNVYNGTDLDFSTATSDQGELDKDGYYWNEADKILTLQDFMMDKGVILPGDVPVKVVTQGYVYIGSLYIDGNCTADVSLLGNGQLNVGVILYGDGRLIVETDAEVIAPDGINGGGDSELIVNGKLTAGALGGDYPSILASYVTIGKTGELSVSGMAGIIVLGNMDSLSGALTIEDGGMLSTTCADCSIMAFTDSKEVADKTANDAFILPEGYLTDGYAVRVVEINDDYVEGYAVTIAPEKAELQWSEYSWFMGAGYLTLHSHDWEEWVYDGDGTHSRTCLLDSSHFQVQSCSFTNYVSDGNATCTADGTKTAKCDGCSATDTVADIGSAIGHICGKWNITAEPTLMAAGTAERTCTKNCGYKETAVVPALTDTSVWTVGKRVEPTGETDGSQEYVSEYGTVIIKISSSLVGDTVPDTTGSMITDEDGNTYKITGNDDTGASVVYIRPKSGAKGMVIIPATITTGGTIYKVTAVADNAFKGNSKITKVTIGKNVAAIGRKAFYGCKKLKTIIIKTKKLTRKTVGAKAFQGINKKALIKVPKDSFKTYKTILKSRGAGKKVRFKKA